MFWLVRVNFRHPPTDIGEHPAKWAMAMGTLLTHSITASVWGCCMVSPYSNLKRFSLTRTFEILGWYISHYTSYYNYNSQLYIVTIEITQSAQARSQAADITLVAQNRTWPRIHHVWLTAVTSCLFVSSAIEIQLSHYWLSPVSTQKKSLNFSVTKLYSHAPLLFSNSFSLISFCWPSLCLLSTDRIENTASNNSYVVTSHVCCYWNLFTDRCLAAPLFWLSAIISQSLVFCIFQTFIVIWYFLYFNFWKHPAFLLF
jgi:hypothetical protein